MDKIIRPIERLSGEITVPGDKSISHRVVFIGSMAKGKTKAANFLKADDCIRTVSAFRDMGIDIENREKNIEISGKGLRGLKKPEGELYLGNSGTTIRILPGILAGQDFEATLTGDESLSKRPMERIIEPLVDMGVDIRSKKSDGFPPLVVKGGNVRPVSYSSKVASAQVKSCILLAGLYAKGVTTVTEPFRSRDHTERMLEVFGAKISRQDLAVSVEGGRGLAGREFFIPGDISSAAFFMAAASITEGSDITIRNVGLNPTRRGFLNVLVRMGAKITVQNEKQSAEPYGDIRVRYARLKSLIVKEEEVPLLIDEVPILAVAASRAEGETVIEGVAELRVKETDRLKSMTENLGKMGVSIKSEGEDLVIKGSKKRFSAAKFSSFHDHRTAMSMAVAALASDGECMIKDADCVNKSFPEFFDTLAYLGK